MENWSAKMITCGLLTLRVSLGGGCVVTVEEERAEEERGADEENAFESAVFWRKEKLVSLVHSLLSQSLLVIWASTIQ